FSMIARIIDDAAEPAEKGVCGCGEHRRKRRRKRQGEQRDTRETVQFGKGHRSISSWLNSSSIENSSWGPAWLEMPIACSSSGPEGGPGTRLGRPGIKIG